MSILSFLFEFFGAIAKGLFSALLEHPTEEKKVYNDVKKVDPADDPFKPSDY